MTSSGNRHTDEKRLLDIAAALADSHRIDWESAAADACTTGGVIENLRSIERLGDAFREAGVGVSVTVAGADEDRAPLFTWGHLQVERSLGKGGFGDVYVARDPALDMEVALKLFRRHESNFHLDEARRLARVRHPNVLTVHGAAIHDGTPGLWCDFIHGKTLDTVLAEQGPMGAVEVGRIGVALGRALAALHEAGIIHGDVKASNVMREQGGRIVLMDLGAGRLVGATPGPIYATRSVTAPEVLTGQPPSTAADIYSLGALLFRLFTHSNPRDGSACLRDLRPDIPVGLTQLVEQALCDDPVSRPTAVTLADAFRQMRVEAHTTGASELRRRKAWFVGAGAFMVVGTIFGLWKAGWLTPAAERPLRVSGQQSVVSSRGSVRQAAFSPDGGRIAFVGDESGRPQVWVQDRAGGQRRRVTDATANVAWPTWTPDGARIVYTEWGKIQSVSPDRSDVITLTQGWNAHVGPRTGRLLFERGEEIWIADHDGGHAGRLTGIPERETRISERLPVFSPDESHIAFMHGADRPWGDVWVIPATGGTARQVTVAGAAVGRLVWTPDGRRIIFPSRIGGRVALRQVDVRRAMGDGPRQAEPLLLGEGEDTDPAASPDGRSLLFTSTRSNYSITTLDLATGTERTLRESREHLVNPSFSNDARRIAFFGWGHDGELHVYTMAADGGQVFQVTAGAGEDGESTFPVWSADDRELFFYRVTPERSWRRISASGGRSIEVRRGWSATEQHMIRLDTSGQRAVYTWYERNVARATRIIDLASGEERSFHHLLRLPSFTPDGRWIIGMDAAPHPNAIQGPLVACPIQPGSCRPLAASASYSKASADGATVYFQRPAGSYNSCELWSVAIDGTNLKRLHAFTTDGPWIPSFDVDPSRNIVLQRFLPGQHELWLAELWR
jgi:Tol biopolymer transport system component